MKDCLLPQNLPEELQHWLLMDAHLELLVRRYEQNLHALTDRQEFLRATRPPFFQVKARQLAITEEQRLEAETRSLEQNERQVVAAAREVERIVVGRLSELILALDPESAVDSAAVLDQARHYARANWLDETQNDEALVYILGELDKQHAPPPNVGLVASVYGADEHPKAVAAGDPWACSD